MGICPPIGKEKKGQYPENIWNDINVRFLGALLAQKLMHHDNRILFQATSGFKLRIYSGQFIREATITVSWLAIPARNTSAFVVV